MAAPSLDVMKAVIEQLTTTDGTKKTYRQPYPALLPTKHSQAGRTVLVTGGGTSVGYAIAKAFVQSSAKTVIIIGRRLEVLETAQKRLLDFAKAEGLKTDVIARACDLTISSQVAELWGTLASEGVVVDVLISNAASFPEPKPLLDLGAEQTWAHVETNAKAPLFFAEKFVQQLGEKKGYIVNVSSHITHIFGHPMAQDRPVYGLSKMFGTLIFQYIAQNTPADKVQIVSYHPGLIYSGEWEKMGVPQDLFDNDELCGAFANWLATDQASFLHGRYALGSWDFEELSAPNGPLRQRIEKDPYFLRGSIVGFNTMKMA